jgi:hypothetical protein
MIAARGGGEENEEEEEQDGNDHRRRRRRRRTFSFRLWTPQGKHHGNNDDDNNNNNNNANNAGNGRSAAVVDDNDSSSSSSSLVVGMAAATTTTTATATTSPLPRPPTKTTNSNDAKMAVAIAARWRRSAAVLVGCVATWAFATIYPPQWCCFLTGSMIPPRRRLSPVQASAVTGLVASLLVTTSTNQMNTTKTQQQQNHNKNGPALAAAMFCGSFAGMSSRVLTTTTMAGGGGSGTWGVAGQMGTMAALVYYVFDARQIGVGVGGRLGVVGLLANVGLGTLWGWSDCRVPSVVVDTVQRLGGLRMTMVLAALALALTAPWQGSSTSVGGGDIGAAVGDSSVEQRRTKVQKWSKTAIKTIMLGLLLVFSSGAVRTVTALGSLVATWTTIYTSAIIILRAAPDHVVRAAALVGLVTGTILPARLGAASYVGAFIGMTRRYPPLSLPPQRRFLSGPVAQASFLAALLQGGGMWTGLGGRLGALAFVSVLFSLY